MTTKQTDEAKKKKVEIFFTARETAQILNSTESGLSYQRKMARGMKSTTVIGQVAYKKSIIVEHLDAQIKQAQAEKKLALERMAQAEKTRAASE